MVELYRSRHVPQTILSDLAIPPLAHQSFNVHSRNAMAFRRLDAKGFAVKIQVKLASGSLTSADAVEGQLLGQIAVWIGLVTVAQPVFARNWHVELSRTQIEKRHVKPA